MKATSAAAALVFGLAVLGAFVAAVVFEPLDHGYLRYAAIAEAIVRNGDWIVPVHDGEIYVLKPPLFLWLIALPIRVVGAVPEWASHVPVVLGALCSVLATFRVGRRMFGSTRAGVLAALFLATMPELASEWRGERIDPLFSGLLACALDAAHEAIMAEGSPRRGVLVRAALFLGLALLAKGPAALLFFALVVVPFAWRRRRLGVFLHAPGLVALSVLLLVILPWPLAFLHRVGFAAGLESVSSADFATRRGPAWEYLAKLPLALGPWTLLLPALIVWLRPRGTTAPLRRVEFAAWWIALPALALLVSPARHMRYLAPFLPAFALAFAGCVTDALAAPKVALLVKFCFAAILALAVVLGFSCAVAVVVDALGLATWLPPRMITARVLLVTGGIGVAAGALRVLRSARFARSHGATLVACVALAMFALLDVLRVGEYRAAFDRNGIERAIAMIPDDRPLVMFEASEPRADLLQLVSRRTIERTDSTTLLETISQRAGGILELVTHSDGAAALSREPTIAVERVARFFAWKDESFEVLRVRRTDP